MPFASSTTTALPARLDCEEGMPGCRPINNIDIERIWMALEVVHMLIMTTRLLLLA